MIGYYRRGKPLQMYPNKRRDLETVHDKHEHVHLQNKGSSYKAALVLFSSPSLSLPNVRRHFTSTMYMYMHVFVRYVLYYGVDIYSRLMIHVSTHSSLFTRCIL